jgi:hypothetical protein
MSELVSNGGECKDPQSLLTEYNLRYFGCRLRQYKVLLTNALNPDCGRCEKRKRRIYINPVKEDVSVILLHEMVHAAVGPGHDKKWRDEVRRLVELGAPLQKELIRYSPENRESLKQLLSEFCDVGLYAPPDWIWSEVRREVGHKYGITYKQGRVKSRRWSRFLRRARREWSRGRALAIA